MSPGLVSGVGGRVKGPLKIHIIFFWGGGGLLLGGSCVEKWGDYQDNFVEAVIPFKE